ncbi:MAG: hypothetical protein CMJ78_03120 [Planctomycetaceae bacterium]|nr:hypothetical protein [Planctomycetaceae bacterium]
MSDYDSLKGSFLIAGKDLRDRNFYKTVVLIVEHGENGAMGLVINRPSTMSVAHVLSEHFQLPETNDLVYVGGPVEPAALFVLHNCPHLDESGYSVAAGVYVGSSAESFQSVIEEAIADDSDFRYRIFSGFAGWAPGQLEGEMDRGDWFIQPFGGEFVLNDDPYYVWDELMERVHLENRMLLEVRVDPEWN